MYLAIQKPTVLRVRLRGYDYFVGSGDTGRV